MRYFEKYFKLPFRLDNFGDYVFDTNERMVFTFAEDVEVQKDLVKKINGEDVNIDVELNLLYEPSLAVILNGIDLFIDIRGWGYLTGTGGLNLPDEQAQKIQDDLAEYIIEKLK